MEVDESYFGGLEKNKHAKKKLNAGKGPGGQGGCGGGEGPENEAREGASGRAHEQGDVAAVRRVQSRAGRDGLHG